MTNAKFEVLVKRLELLSRKQPKRYQFLVGAIAILGYAYIVGIIAIAIALLAGTIAGFGWMVSSSHSVHTGAAKVFIVFVGFLCLIIFALLSAIWHALTIKFPQPVGLPLNRQDFPELAALVDRLAREIGITNLRKILLVPEFNASVVQLPKYGAFGGIQNYLIIGLPLLQTINPQQFTAILAHEFGHLSSNHSKFDAWICRLSIAYSQLLAGRETSQSDYIFAPFLKWYVPRLNAYSFVLRRRNEYIADRFAVKIAGANSTADALILTDIYATNLDEEFWSPLYQSVDSESIPPQDVFHQLASFVRQGVATDKAQQLLDRCLSAQTNYADTHPCLLDRLQAIGYQGQIDLPAPIQTTAAEKYLGRALATTTQKLNEVWHQSILPQWQARHQYASEAHRGIVQLERKAQDEGLTADEMLQLACWTGEFREITKAIEMLHQGVERYPDRGDFHYQLALMLVSEREMNAGLTHFERAMHLEPSYIPGICETLYQIADRSEDLEFAKQCLQTIDRYLQSLTDARQERLNLFPTDRLEPHNLPAEEIEEIYNFLISFPEVKTVYLVRKLLTNFDTKPHHFLIVVFHYSWHKLTSDDAQPTLYQKIADRLELSTGYTLFVLALGQYGDKTKVMKQIQQMDDAMILDRDLRVRG